MSSLSEIKSKCLLCQANVKDEHTKSAGMSSAYLKWNTSCATSLCQLFNLDTYPFRMLFLKAVYCSPCHLLIRNIDFNIRSINSLQQNLKESRNSVEALLRENFDKIQDCENPISEGSPMANSYSNIVKLVFETVSARTNASKIVKPVIFKVSPDRSHNESYTSVQLSDAARKSYLNRLKFTASSSRLKRRRIVTAPSYRNDKDLETDHSDDSDFVAEDEPNLPDDDNNLDFENGNSDSDIIGPKTHDTNTETSKIKRSKPSRKPTKKSTSTGKPKPKTQSVSSRVKYNCTFDTKCKYSSTSTLYLNAHINEVHKGEKKPFHCEICKEAAKKYAFASPANYAYHQSKHHPTSEPTIFCDICNKPFIAKWELRKHMKVTHGGTTRKMRCLHCKKMFDEDKQNELATHEELHKSQLKPFACVLCDTHDCTNSQQLSVHVRQEHEETSLKCEFCNKAFTTQFKLDRHVNAAHGDGKRKPDLQCKLCSFRAVYPSALQRHAKWHSDQRNFQCDKCPKSYKSKSCLKYHINITHGKERAFKCNMCDKAFGTRSQLRTHEETHNSVKSYYCEICGKAFMAKNHLSQHMRGHAGKLRLYRLSHPRIRKPKTGTEVRKPKTGPRIRKARNPPAASKRKKAFDTASTAEMNVECEVVEMDGEVPMYDTDHKDEPHLSTLDVSQGMQFLMVLQEQSHTAYQ